MAVEKQKEKGKMGQKTLLIGEGERKNNNEVGREEMTEIFASEAKKSAQEI